MDQNRRYEEHEAHSIAVALYDGGWRAEDKEQMMEEHGFTEENMDLICDWLKTFEIFDKLKDFEELKAEEEEDI